MHTMMQLAASTQLIDLRPSSEPQLVASLLAAAAQCEICHQSINLTALPCANC